jgi:hypothetical protein
MSNMKVTTIPPHGNLQKIKIKEEQICDGTLQLGNLKRGIQMSNMNVCAISPHDKDYKRKGIECPIRMSTQFQPTGDKEFKERIQMSDKIVHSVLS